MKRAKKSSAPVCFFPISRTPRTNEERRSFDSSAPLYVALGTAIFVGGCSSDSLKRPFSTTSGPTSIGAATLADSSTPSPGAGASTIVAGTDYVEATNAATPTLGTTYYRAETATASSNPPQPPAPLPSFYANSPDNAISASSVNAAPLPPYPAAPTSDVATPYETDAYQNNFQEATRLREELIAARADVKRQVDANESLLRQSATLRRDAEEAVAELRRENAELAEKNRVLLANASELQAERSLNERRLQIQNAALRKAPTTVVVPNNSAANLDLKLSDPQILPIRRDGDSPTIELQDALLFEPNDSTRLSEEGKTRLRILATEILRRYPTNVLSIQGHSDADPARLGDDPMRVQAESVQKAYLVAEFLADETGVARNQTIVGGCGAVRPIVSNETETNRRRNRRVEISILSETVVPNLAPPTDAGKTISF